MCFLNTLVEITHVKTDQWPNVRKPGQESCGPSVTVQLAVLCMEIIKSDRIRNYDRIIISVICWLVNDVVLLNASCVVKHSCLIKIGFN